MLVNNAGQGLHVAIEEIDPADLRAVFELHVVAALVGMQTVLPVMRLQAAGSIVNVGSATSLRLLPGLGGYSATKAALNMVSEVARLELAGSGVTVSVVYPSGTATEFHERLRAGRMADGARNIPRHPPELVGEAIAFAITTGEAHVLVGDPPGRSSPGKAKAGRLFPPGNHPAPRLWGRGRAATPRSCTNQQAEAACVVASDKTV